MLFRYGAWRSVRSQLNHSNPLFCHSRLDRESRNRDEGFTPMHMEKLCAEYIVGLVDGEGSFTVYVKDPDSFKQVKRRTKVEPRFYLKLIERDRNILYELKKFFGCGNVYFQGDKRTNHQDCYRFEVTSRDDLQSIIIPFFRKNSLMLRSKRYDFEIFCQILEMVTDKKHLTESGLRNIYNLKQKMH